jgi:hypothetical protein
MKIGIGCSTYNRPKHLELWKEQTYKYTPYFFDLSIEDDSKDRRGIAYRKNNNLMALRKCDYIFLFDDDCFPIKEGWAELFINASKASGQQHFMYLKETPTIKKTGNWTNFVQNATYINKYDNCAGCMMFFTKEVIEKVGAYNPKYGKYGFEHAGYSERIHKAGLTPLGAYTCPAGAGEYIYSLDLDNHLPFNKQVKHEPSMAKEIQNIPIYIQQNKDIYLQDTEIYIPL